MRLIRGLHNLKNKLTKGAVATIGNYDGVHIGHQQILSRLKQKSKELKIPSVVIIFEPQPEEFFTNNKSLRLTSLREKVYLFTKYDIDYTLVLSFNSHFSCMTADYFIQKVLIETINIKYLITGDDFSFGHNRSGDSSLLNKFLTVEKIPSFRIDGVRVSSSFIRTCLMQGNLKVAAEFLGRSYLISGRVIHGDHFGRKLGFPTANICLAGRDLPLEGVFCVNVYGLEKKPLLGVANIGFRPTVSGKFRSFEIHIINFNSNIYGKRIEIEFCDKIRDERKFASLEELKLQIKKDIQSLITHMHPVGVE